MAQTQTAAQIAQTQDPKQMEPQPPFAEQRQQPPGIEQQMQPRPDYGEQSYRGHDRLTGKVALITGGDSGIGRAVALAFAREGADVVFSYLNEEPDAQETTRVEVPRHNVCRELFEQFRVRRRIALMDRVGRVVRLLPSRPADRGDLPVGRSAGDDGPRTGRQSHAAVLRAAATTGVLGREPRHHYRQHSPAFGSVRSDGVRVREPWMGAVVVDGRASFKVLDSFAASGLNLIDTADVYSVWVPGHTWSPIRLAPGRSPRFQSAGPRRRQPFGPGLSRSFRCSRRNLH